MVFDSHVHIQPWKMLKEGALKLIAGKRPENVQKMMYDPELFLNYLNEQGVERACIINYISPDIMGFTDQVNEFSSQYAKKCQGRVVPYGSLDLRNIKSSSDELKRLYDAGIRGIKIHPSHQLIYPNEYRDGLDTLGDMYKTAQELKIPVMIHTGTSIFPGARNVYADPIYVDDVAIDFPELTIILAHGGRPLWTATAVFLVRRFKNVFLDISSMPMKNVPEYFPQIDKIKDKVLFGSDWPAPGVPNIKDVIAAFQELPIQGKEEILYINASKIYTDK